MFTTTITFFYKTKIEIIKYIALQNAIKNPEQRRLQYNKEASNVRYASRDKVVLYGVSCKANEPRKLKPKYRGPYLITETLGNNLFKLHDVASRKEIKRPVHFDRLRMLKELDDDYRL